MTAGNPGHSFVPRDGVGFAQTPGAVVVLQAEPGAAMVVPHGALLLVADFVRQGSDLLLVGPDGIQILIKGYFALDHPPALITEGGAMLAPDHPDLTPETWSRLNVSLGLFEGGQDATKTTYLGTDHKQAA